MARAAELEAQILAEEEAAEDARKTRERRAKADPTESSIYSSVSLAQREAQEYGYVQRDLRRIAIVGGGLLLVLFLIDIIFNVTNVL